MGGGIALVKTIDPVALFANVNYRHTFSRDFSDVSPITGILVGGGSHQVKVSVDVQEIAPET